MHISENALDLGRALEAAHSPKTPPNVERVLDTKSKTMDLLVEARDLLVEKCQPPSPKHRSVVFDRAASHADVELKWHDQGVVKAGDGLYRYVVHASERQLPAPGACVRLALISWLCHARARAGTLVCASPSPCRA